MLELTPMNEPEFSDYVKIAKPLFACEKMRGEGLTAEEAAQVADESFNRLLPMGLQTPGHFLFVVREASQPAGYLWFARKESGLGDYAYIYDIYLFPEFRGRGLGAATMNLAEEQARRQGLRAVKLHVFGHNQVAQNLYEKLGFQTTNRIMSKDL
ncbi:MAG: GNAT family N-acetyltransferase [Bdellovibrionales bacterium]